MGHFSRKDLRIMSFRECEVALGLKKRPVCGHADKPLRNHWGIPRGQ